MQTTKLKCSIGVMAHNEENNISIVLNTLLLQRLKTVEIDEIIVISSGSTDNTNTIVQSLSEKNDKIKLFTQKERRGKSSAINLFLLKAKNDILVLVSADVIPGSNTVENLVTPFNNSTIGMTGGRIIPANESTDFVGFSVNLLWKLHHKMSVFKPKLGEMVAFRKVFDSIPRESAVDEASIEALITKAGLRCMYVADAVIHNQGPQILEDFIKQRKRIATGHLWLKNNQNYNVTSNSVSLLIGLYLQECVENPKDIIYITGTAKLEIYCRFLGWFDYYIRQSNPYIWEMIKR